MNTHTKTEFTIGSYYEQTTNDEYNSDTVSRGVKIIDSEMVKVNGKYEPAYCVVNINRMSSEIPEWGCIHMYPHAWREITEREVRSRLKVSMEELEGLRGNIETYLETKLRRE